MAMGYRSFWFGDWVKGRKLFCVWFFLFVLCVCVCEGEVVCVCVLSEVVV